MFHSSRWFFATIAVSFVFAGAGCSRLAGPDMQPAGPRLSQLEGLSPEEAAKKINFIPGSIVEMRQTFLGFGAKLAAKLAGENKEGTRIVVLSRFAPQETANIEWKLSTKVEADSSIKARADARKAGKPVPEPVMVDQTAAGTMKAFNLRDSHLLYLPAFWPDKEEAPSFAASGIWLSKDVYEGLARNYVSTVDFGLLDPSLTGTISKLADFRAAFTGIATKKAAIENRTDVFKLDGEDVEWSLNVNGKEVKVAAIKAKNWFGEIIVLKNPQNPLILKVTLNPITGGLDPLKALVGYEVTQIVDAQE